MKGFVKFLKNLLWLCLVLVLLAGIGGICFGFYDYYSGNKEPYDRLLTQAKFMVLNLKNKITGEEMVELTIEEVSPSKQPVMNLSIEGINRDVVVLDEENRQVIFVYGKDIGGDLYFPYRLAADERIDAAWLFTGNEADMTDITEYVSYDPVSWAGVVSQKFLTVLEPGEYYIFLDPVNGQGDGVGSHCVPLIVEEQTTYISIQQGFIRDSDSDGFIYNDLQSIHPIMFPFYNLGDDRIVMVSELIDGLPGQYTEHSLGSEDYEINAVGNGFILTEEYLSGLKANEMRRFKVVLGSGRSFDTGYTRLFTVDGEPDWLSMSGPVIYDKSEGGDFILDIHKGFALKYHYVSMWANDPDELLMEDLMDQTGDDLNFLDEENDRIVIPESVMMSLDSNRPHNFVLAYVYPGTGYINYHFCFEVVS